ncbi:MAG: hypothetical protein JJT76_19680 [Clostridiaceae bacterium]|nr:hypothetical protein [Clostridiaceae bacterium]
MEKVKNILKLLGCTFAVLITPWAVLEFIRVLFWDSGLISFKHYSLKVRLYLGIIFTIFICTFIIVDEVRKNRTP